MFETSQVKYFLFSWTFVEYSWDFIWSAYIVIFEFFPPLFYKGIEILAYQYLLKHYVRWCSYFFFALLPLLVSNILAAATK